MALQFPTPIMKKLLKLFQYSTQFSRAQGQFSTKDRFFRKRSGKKPQKSRPAPANRAAVGCCGK
jgi:hypothetical protein